MTITDGKVGVANATLPAQDGAALALAGALDLNTGIVDARMTLSAQPPAHALISHAAGARCHAQRFARGAGAQPRRFGAGRLAELARRRTANPPSGIDRSQWTAGRLRPRGSSGLFGCQGSSCRRPRRIRRAGERVASRSARIGSVADRSAGCRRHRIDNGKQAAARAAAGSASSPTNSGTAA